MPIHDWTRVDAGIFHSFHTTWIGELTKVLNSGLLPPEYYALGEQLAGEIGPDVLTRQTPASNGNDPTSDPGGAVAVRVAPPKVQLTVRFELDDYTLKRTPRRPRPRAGPWVRFELDDYTLKRRTLVISHRSNHRIVALIEILSPGNKAGQHAFDTFLNKAVSALAHGIHLLLIDLHPPTPRDPHGLHVALWQQLTDEPQGPLFTEKLLTLAAYVGGPNPTAYIEPVAVGDSLADMPLFLDPDHYINVPLEATYQAAYAGVPRIYRTILESPSGAAPPGS